jgi:hypothetical protein
MDHWILRSDFGLKERRLVMNPRLFRLIETHERIDRALQGEQKRPLPDWFRLLRLKKLKLRAKDLIHRLTLRPERI